MKMGEPNPFEILEVGPAATDDDVVKRAGEKRQRATTAAELAEVRRAVQALTASAKDRCLLSLLAHPRPAYNAPALVRLAQIYRSSPLPASSNPACPAIDLAEFADLAAVRMAAELEPPQLPFAPVGSEEEPAEVRRQSAEAIWEGLIFDTRA